MNTRNLWLSLLAASTFGAAQADTIFLKNGDEIDGTVVEENTNIVVVKTRAGVLRSLRRLDVDTIVYETKKPAPVKKEEPVVAKKEEPKPADGTAKPEEGATKPAEGTAEAKPETKPESKPEGTAEASPEKKDDKVDESKWTPPEGLPSFPKFAKRMKPADEAIFMESLEKLTDEKTREAAKGEISRFGKDALPYIVAGIQHSNVDARTVCMTLLGGLADKSAVKAAIEVFYSAMPESGSAATYQTPFIRAIKTTLPALTGQTFINVEPDKEMVQDGLKKYVEWYNAEFDRLPPQLGEPKIAKTDPDYMKKLKEARALKLEKKSWPRPVMPADLAAKPGETPVRPAVPPGATERKADENFRDNFNKNKVGRDDALKRPNDK